MKKFGSVIGSIVFAVLFLGCASYNAVVPNAANYNTAAVEKTVDDVKVSALPVYTKEDAKKYFDDETISRNGLIPVYVYVSLANNAGDHRITSITLSTPDNKVLNRLSLEEAYQEVRKWYAGRVLAWGVLAPIAMPFSAINVSNTNDAIKEDMKAKDFVAEEIKWGEVSQGFVYFKIDEKSVTLDGFSAIFCFRGDDEKTHEIILPFKGKITAKSDETGEKK